MEGLIHGGAYFRNFTVTASRNNLNTDSFRCRRLIAYLAEINSFSKRPAVLMKKKITYNFLTATHLNIKKAYKT